MPRTLIAIPPFLQTKSTLAVTNENPQFGALDIWLIDLWRGIRSRFTSDPECDCPANLVARREPYCLLLHPGMAPGTCIRKLISGIAQEELLLQSE